MSNVHVLESRPVEEIELTLYDVTKQGEGYEGDLLIEDGEIVGTLPKGMSYNEETAVLTLNNYEGETEELSFSVYGDSDYSGEMTMIPMNLSAYRLAHEIHVPVSRIQDILHDRRKITADTSLRLAKFFGVSDRYFLDMQNDIDIRELKRSMEEEIAGINPCVAAAI